MFEPEVKIIADSLCETRLTTFQVKYWRPILAEMNTHRAFSRNAASSRAMSFSKRCDAVREEAWTPAHWNAEQAGMVGGTEFSEEVKKVIDLDIQKLASATANYLEELNSKIQRITGKSIHKQYLNRYLEPFTYVTQLITATEWDNFFKLRTAEDAQPEIRDVALQMQALYNENMPKEVNAGDWHLPYIANEEREQYALETLKKISVARCARVSYRPYDGNTVLEKDIALYDRLLKNGHMSPFEHVAMADPTVHGNHANFDGWLQLRHIIK